MFQKENNYFLITFSEIFFLLYFDDLMTKLTNSAVEKVNFLGITFLLSNILNCTKCS